MHGLFNLHYLRLPSYRRSVRRWRDTKIHLHSKCQELDEGKNGRVGSRFMRGGDGRRRGVQGTGGRPPRIAFAACLMTVALFSTWSPAAAQASPAQTDVMFVFDTSGSMEPVLEEAKTEIKSVMAQLEGSLPDVAFGVAEVRDYGGSEYDPELDEPWKLDVPVTSNSSTVTDAVSGLSADGGGDSPEAYGRALWETDTNPNVGWRPEARHLIVLIADQVPHNPNLNEDIPEEFWAEPSPWDTGEELPGSWDIPGTQLKEGEILDFHAVLHKLANDGKPLEAVDYHDSGGGDYIHYWEHWAGIAGGTAVSASEHGKELAARLISLVEAAGVPCATTALPAQASPLSSGAPPTATTPRFLQPGSAVVLTPPSGTGFCKGQQPALGGSVVSTLEESTASKIAFRTPPTATSGLALTSRSGILGSQQSFEVDNFRYPWGFSIGNSAGNGSGGTYDENVAVSPQDLDSVFKELGSPGSEVYDWVKSEAEAVLHGGLCYGFSVLTRSLYDDAHGGHDALAYADSPGFALSPGEESYPLTEAGAGLHVLTHALLRAAISQLSPEARLSWHSMTSAGSLEAQLNSAFQLGQPAVLIVRFNGGAHAVLAFNYEKTAAGLAVDVVDPNVPWSSGRPASDYQMMQIAVQGNGAWSYNGTFDGSPPFGKPVNGPSGSLLVAPEPRSPGGLTLWYNASAPTGTEINPGAGATAVSISYSAKPGHGIPSDVRQGELADDAPDDRLVVPPNHKLITITQAAGPSPLGTSYIAGSGFLDVLRMAHGAANETVETRTGAISAPRARKGDMLGVTSVVRGAQQTVNVTFRGDVVKPTLEVSSSGQVTLTTRGGAGKASMSLIAYTPAGRRGARVQTVGLRGRTRIHLHTPKPKHHKRTKGKHPKRR
jgi:hypothetical protein